MRLLPLCLVGLVLGCAWPLVTDHWARTIPVDSMYSWDTEWGAMPEGQSIGNTHGGMAVDARGRIYASRDTAPAVLVFNQRGRLVDSWGEELGGGLHGLCLREEDGEEYLYLAHTGRHEVGKATLDGEILWTVGVPMESGLYESAGQYLPTGIAVAGDGSFYVADGYGKGVVHRYGADREYLGWFGGPGEGDGQFRTPHGIIVDERRPFPRVLVADRENGRVQSFDMDGDFLEVLPVEFRRPCGFALGTDGTLAVPELAGRVSVLDADDNLLGRPGDNPNQDQWANNGLPTDRWTPGLFISPHGAAFDGDGNLFVQDWVAAGRFTRLVRTVQ